MDFERQYTQVIILHLIPCSLQNIDESVPVCLELKLCQSRDLVRLSSLQTGWPALITCTGVVHLKKN